MAKKSTPVQIDAIRHNEDRRTNIPTAELEPVVPGAVQAPVPVEYPRRNPDLDPQLIWRGKYDGDETLTVQAPPLYIQEKIHPKSLIEDLKKASKTGKDSTGQLGLFADFNGFAPGVDKTDFYQHDQNWTNRMILGDSLQVMASLAEREGMRGKVQCIYLDPPYGIKFNSNFQWSTTSRDVKDGKLESFTREPEQVKAFRDTWRDGIHSYLSYLRDRFIVARDLLTESGSIFVQIGDENVHYVRNILEEVFRPENLVSQISFVTTSGFSNAYLSSIFNYILWFCKDIKKLKYKQLFADKQMDTAGMGMYRKISTIKALNKSPIDKDRVGRLDNITSQGAYASEQKPFICRKSQWLPPKGMHWKTNNDGLERLNKAERIILRESTVPAYLRFIDDFAVLPINSLWSDTGTGGFTDDKIYVVQTNTKVISRCLLMATDPGDLVLDPTCGSGTTAYVAEQWGRRWITIDTSRVALALARARLMGARYPWYIMTDSPEGQAKEADLSGRVPSRAKTFNNIKQGFVYERVPHITLKSIANNAEIDVIHEHWQKTLEPLREKLNAACATAWEEWQVPREAGQGWSKEARKLHADWWEARISRQREIDKSIAAKAEFEFLYDKPYEDKGKVRVAGPFTVESISPVRAIGVDADGSLLDPAAGPKTDAPRDGRDFVAMILDNLRTSGVQQAHKEGKIAFTSLTPWPGELVAAEGRYEENGTEKRAAVFVGPEFGTVGRQDVVRAAKEAADAQFDVLIACAFNYDAQTADLRKLGALPILLARMNADLHMGEELKNTGKGNLFVIFGEPDIDVLHEHDAADTEELRVRINGVDIYYPASGQVEASSPDEIACWFVDTDYNDESFFVRQAYFLGANDPYKQLKTTLRAQIDADAWESIHSDVSRPFPRPASGRIAVKVINHLGDEVMRVYDV